jgi:hypothetical protein
MEPVGLSLTDAGIALGGTARPTSRATLYRRIADGTLEAFKFGSRTLITPESIRRAREAGMVN